jgi:hypothetical protein
MRSDPPSDVTLNGEPLKILVSVLICHPLTIARATPLPGFHLLPVQNVSS